MYGKNDKCCLARVGFLPFTTMGTHSCQMKLNNIALNPDDEMKSYAFIIQM